MGLNFAKKQLIKINPYIIDNGRFFKAVDDETIMYALNNGYDITKLSDENIIGKLLYPSFVREFTKSKDSRFNAIISSNFYMIPSENKEEVINELLNTDFIPNKETSYELRKDIRIFMRLLEKEPSSIEKVYGNYNIEIEEKDINANMQQLINAFDSSNVSYGDLPIYMKENPRILSHFIKKKRKEILDDIYSNADRTIYKDRYNNIKAIVKIEFFNNLEENIQYVGEYKKVIPENNLTEREKEKLIEAASKYKYVSSYDDYSFLLNNQDVMFNSIMNMQNIEDLKKLNSVIFEKFSDERKKQVGAKIASFNIKSLTEKNIPAYIFYSKSVKEELIKKDPYNCEELNKKNYFIQFSDELVNEMLEKGYVISDKTPENFFEHLNNSTIIEELEKNFEVLSSKLVRGNREFNEEENPKIYEICCENGYVLSEDSPECLKNNPFLLRDAIQNGSVDIHKLNSNQRESLEKINFDINPKSTIEDKEYEILRYNSKDKSIILESIEKYFPSIKYAGADIKEFSKEEQERIAELYLENLDDLDNDRDILYSDLITKNPYVHYELYKRGINPHKKYGYLIIEDDELLRKIAEEYWKNKGTKLTSESLDIEKSNPYIILKSIEEDVNTIDYIGNIADKRIVEKVKELYFAGKYTVHEKSPKCIFRDQDIVKDLLDKDMDLVINKCEGSSLPRGKFGEEAIEKIMNAVEENKIVLKLNARNHWNQRIVKNSEYLLKAIQANPKNANAIDYMFKTPDILLETMLQKIQEGKYIVTDETPEWILMDEKIQKYLFKDINNISFFNRDILNDTIYSLPQKEVEKLNEELLKRVDEAIEKGTFELKSNKISDILYNKDDENSKKRLEYFIKQNVYNINLVEKKMNTGKKE